MKKPIFKSKTVLVNLVVALSTLYPPVGEWVANNPTATVNLLVVLNLILRLVTDKKVTLFAEE